MGYRAMWHRGSNDHMQQFQGRKARFDLGRAIESAYLPLRPKKRSRT